MPSRFCTSYVCLGLRNFSCNSACCQTRRHYIFILGLKGEWKRSDMWHTYAMPCACAALPSHFEHWDFLSRYDAISFIVFIRWNCVSVSDIDTTHYNVLGNSHLLAWYDIWIQKLFFFVGKMKFPATIECAENTLCHARLRLRDDAAFENPRETFCVCPKSSFREFCIL